MQTLPVAWDRYDADSGVLHVVEGSANLAFSVTRDEAQQLAGRKSDLALRTQGTLEARIVAAGDLVDTKTGVRFPPSTGSG